MWYILLVVIGLLVFRPFNFGITVILLSMIFIGLSDPSASKAPIRYNDIVRKIRPVLIVIIFALYWVSKKSLLDSFNIPDTDEKYVNIACMVLWAYMVITEIIIFIKYKDS